MMAYSGHTLYSRTSNHFHIWFACSDDKSLVELQVVDVLGITIRWLAKA